MNQRFRTYVDSLEPSYRRLVEMAAVTVPTLPRNMPRAGIYLFSEGFKHLYVGRSGRLRARLQEHCRPSSTHNSAPFAFRLARDITGLKRATYIPQGSRADLERHPRFREAFTKAKARVRSMDVRFVKEAEAPHQALLEIYVAVSLQTQFNDFETH